MAETAHRHLADEASSVSVLMGLRENSVRWMSARNNPACSASACEYRLCITKTGTCTCNESEIITLREKFLIYGLALLVC